jgi:hypothetical protein
MLRGSTRASATWYKWVLDKQSDSARAVPTIIHYSSYRVIYICRTENLSAY